MKHHMVLSRTLALALVLAAASKLACAEALPTPTAAPTATPAPTTPTSPPAPSPTPVSLTPPTPTLNVTDTEYDPCGLYLLGYYGPLHEGFLHWTGDGSHLVFEQYETLWVLNIEGDSLLTVADTNRNDRSMYGFYADVSPDGSQIVYTSCEFMLDKPEYGRTTEGYELVMINIDGTGKTRLTNNRYLDHYRVWSPDGTYIAFVRYGGYESAFYPTNPERRKGVKLATSSSERPGIPLLPTNDVALYPPAWSPDSQTLAYIVNEGDYTPELVVWTVAVDKKTARIGKTISPPTWSPDGEELAYVSVEGIELVVYASMPDGTGRREVWRGNVSYNAGEYGQALWSPDGAEILVISDQAYLVSADGSEQRSLDHDGPVGQAAWSPDGSWIALRDFLGISIVSRDGAELRVVAEAGQDGWLQAVQSAQPEATTEPATSSPVAVPTEPSATTQAQ